MDAGANNHIESTLVSYSMYSCYNSVGIQNPRLLMLGERQIGMRTKTAMVYLLPFHNSTHTYPGLYPLRRLSAKV